MTDATQASPDWNQHNEAWWHKYASSNCDIIGSGNGQILSINKENLIICFIINQIHTTNWINEAVVESNILLYQTEYFRILDLSVGQVISCVNTSR